MIDAPSGVLAFYAANEQRLRDELAGLERSEDLLSNLRLISGLGVVAAAVWALIAGSIAWLALVVLLALVFLFFVYRHRIASARRLRTEVLADINREAIDRIHRNW